MRIHLLLCALLQMLMLLLLLLLLLLVGNESAWNSIYLSEHFHGLGRCCTFWAAHILQRNNVPASM